MTVETLVREVTVVTELTVVTIVTVVTQLCDDNKFVMINICEKKEKNHKIVDIQSL